MHLQRYDKNPILTANPLHSWESSGVFNPGVIFDDGIFHMLYRATNKRWAGEEGYTSTIGYATSSDGIHFTRNEKPFIIPDKEYELNIGCEDPRIAKISDIFYVTYTAVQGTFELRKIRLALATTKDFKTITKHGVISPPNMSAKAGAFFSEKVNVVYEDDNGRVEYKQEYALLWTKNPDEVRSTILISGFTIPEELISKSPLTSSALRERTHTVIQPSPNVWRGPEVGGNPIKTKHGWLIIYSGSNNGDYDRWTIDAALLDLDNPAKLLAHTPYPLLTPELEQEKNGLVKNVVFPSSALDVNGILYVYYGYGDEGIGLATCKIDDLIDHLIQNPVINGKKFPCFDKKVTVDTGRNLPSH